MDTERWPQRKQTRLRSFDYRAHGYYLVTIATWLKIRWLGLVDQDGVHLSEAGRLVVKYLLELPDRFDGLRIDEWAIMPDHLHVIIEFSSTRDGESFPWTLGQIVGAFKSLCVAQLARRGLGFPHPPWQRGFHDRVIRHEHELAESRTYLRRNPSRWLEKHGRG